MKKISGGGLVLVMLFVACIANATSAADYALNKDRMAEQAWTFYEQGDYDSSREIVDKNYSQESIDFSLLSGMLYFKDGKCGKALAVTDYVIDYLDTHQSDVKENPETRHYYLNLKRLRIECNSELGLWSELVLELKGYLPYVTGEERLIKMLMLGDAQLSVTENSVSKGINVCEKVLSNSKTSKPNGYVEHCLYVLVKLYGYSGEQKKAIGSLVRLLETSSNRKEWVSEIEGSHAHKWMLGEPEVIAVLKSSKE